ncbi:hypothetical protein [Amycolatopsis coloradensis]|nr:hypothetical protein [Amycolatopsis coloradensis]
MIWGWIAAAVMYAAGIACVTRGVLIRRRRKRQLDVEGSPDE